MAKIRWRPEPEADNYPSARSFLYLVYGRREAQRLVKKLRRARNVRFKVADVLRASREPLLDVTNSHVKDNHNKIVDGKALSPPLLIADPRCGRVVVADGYHRLCAAFSFDEDAEMPCRIVMARD